jgi:cytochrome b561
MSAPRGYTAAQIALHWASAILVIAAFVTHDAMQAAAKALRDGNFSGYDAAMLVHVIGGSVVFLLALWRLGILGRRGAPPRSESEPPVLRAAAWVVKVLLYAIMIVMPVSGVLHWFGGVDLAGQLHRLMEPIVPLTILIHLIGALYQQFWLKSGVLTRMLRPEA